MAKRLITGLVVALLVSGGATFFISRKLAGHGAPHSSVARYVAPAHALQAGDVLKPDDLVLVDWPTSIALSNTFTKPGDLSGRVVIYPVAASQPIVDGYLAAPGSGIGLTTKIPDGMRAIALRSDEVMGVAGFIFPGSHLDVLVTCHSERSPEPITFSVLQDAEVLAVGQKSQPDPDGKPATATVVTLLLTPLDAQRAVLASTQGSFHFVLRSGSDKEKVKDVPITLARITGEIPAPLGGAPRPLPVRKISIDPGIVVQTVAGDKQTSDTFGGK